MTKNKANGEDALVIAKPLTIDECKAEFEAGVVSLMETYGIQIIPSLNWLLVQESANGVTMGYYKPIIGTQLARIPGWQPPIDVEDTEDETIDYKSQQLPQQSDDGE